jgi:hypothetical protein
MDESGIDTVADQERWLARRTTTTTRRRIDDHQQFNDIEDPPLQQQTLDETAAATTTTTHDSSGRSDAAPAIGDCRARREKQQRHVDHDVDDHCPLIDFSAGVMTGDADADAAEPKGSSWSCWFRRSPPGVDEDEENTAQRLRRRSFSEPELTRWGHLLSLPRTRRRDPCRSRAFTVHATTAVTPSPLALADDFVANNMADALLSSPSITLDGRHDRLSSSLVAAVASSTSTTADSLMVMEQQQQQQLQPDQRVTSIGSNSSSSAEQVARSRWVRINRHFQNFITVVALLFSILLVVILLCWVALTIAYVIALNQSCDVPLKAYYWFVSLQLLLDVFRHDILRGLLRWDGTVDPHRPPARVILYNVTYLIYALMVLKLGVTSVFIHGGPDENDGVDKDRVVAHCQQTAPYLFKTSKVFVSLSLTAWAVILAGYLVPFTVVAILLTWNGYHPTHTNFPVFPVTNTVSASDAVDHLKVVTIAVVVETPCRHRFHRSCCREWLRQAKTCPVCREPIVEPSTTADSDSNEEGTSQLRRRNSGVIPLGPSGRPVVGLVRMIRRASTRLHEHRQDAVGSVIELRQRNR